MTCFLLLIIMTGLHIIYILLTTLMQRFFQVNPAFDWITIAVGLKAI